MALQTITDKHFENVHGKVAIILADFHEDISNGLLKGVEEVFSQYQGVQWQIHRVPGAFEIPLRAQQLASMMVVHEDGNEEQLYDVILALGCVIKGDTYHFELVANECARGCMEVMLGMGVPVVFEVLATYDLKQAKIRSTGDTNHGTFAAQVTLDWLSKMGEGEGV